MQIFISEYLTSGACIDEEFAPSLLREGLAMLAALMEDVAAIANCDCVTTLDARLKDHQPLSGRVISVESISEAEAQFRELAAQSDAIVVIAPETGDILLKQREQIDEYHCSFIGCSSDAIALCTDKQSLAAYLTSQNIPTIPVAGSECAPFDQVEFSCVIKPRDGAGSQLTFLVETEAELQHALQQYQQGGAGMIPICQPYVEGVPISVAAIVSQEQSEVEIFPIASQNLSDNGRFAYQGGAVPVAVSCVKQIEASVRQTCSTISGLNGYIGWDFVIPTDQPEQPLLVEINPRLTTSYVGYRQLTDENLAERMLFPERFSKPIYWHEQVVTFDLYGARERVV